MKLVSFLLLISSILLWSQLRVTAARTRVLPGWMSRLGPGGDPQDPRDPQEPQEPQEPPLSIDLTFHLLRSMIHLAKLESQRQRAQTNRKLLDEVGK